MVQTVHSMMRDAICETNTATSIELKLRTDGNIIIKEEDWEKLATPVANRLLNPSTDEKECLPVYEQIHFLIKKMGNWFYSLVFSNIFSNFTLDMSLNFWL